MQLNDTIEPLVAAALILFVVACSVNLAIKDTSSHEAWAAQAGKAEYYLDAKTGKVAWRWKSDGCSYFITQP